MNATGTQISTSAAFAWKEFDLELEDEARVQAEEADHAATIAYIDAHLDDAAEKASYGEADYVAAWVVCPIHNEEYPDTHGCASCQQDEALRDEALCAQIDGLTLSGFEPGNHDHRYWI